MWLLAVSCVFSVQSTEKPELQSEVNPSTNAVSSGKDQEISLERQKALNHLRTVLKKYYNRSIYMKMKKEMYIAAIEKKTSEKGELHFQKGKFRISMNSQPAYLTVFDGSHLWYQSDRSEKIVLKFAVHSQIELFSALFDYQSFFKIFSVDTFSFQKNPRRYFYVLTPKKAMGDISKVILSCGKNINGVKMFWEDLGNWQYYIFSNPWFKKSFSDSLFVFNAKGFEILEN